MNKLCCHSTILFRVFLSNNFPSFNAFFFAFRRTLAAFLPQYARTIF